MSDKNARIVSLKAENVKRLKAVRITPEGNLIVIGGKNAQGKTSVLDTIMAGLGGKKYVPGKAVRDGEKKGYVDLDLGDLLVKRTFTDSGGGTIKVMNKDGASYGSPQKILDELMGSISFDPLEFARMSNKEQLSTLKDITGLDFTIVDAKRKEAYDKRTDLNRDIKSIDARIEAVELPESAPAEPVNIRALLEELEQVENYNRQAERKKEELVTIKKVIEQMKEDLQGKEQELQKFKEELTKGIEKKDKLEVGCEELHVEDTSQTKKEIEQAETLNEGYRIVKQVKEMQAEREKLTAETQGLTEVIEIIDEEKAEAIETTDIPVPKLGFGEDGVVYQGIPFDQASDAEKLRVSLAIGMAMNPKLRVLLVRDGSLLDEDNLKIVAEMAEENDFQIWLERVGEGDEVSVIMEDGEVKGGGNE